MKNFVFGFLCVISMFLFSGESALAKEALKIVKTENVCMITNVVFPNKQIPVALDGKTYYGCCENCKKTLTEDLNSRFAIDPVSGVKVDKAKATIAAKPDGTVIYFENAKNVKKYSK